MPVSADALVPITNDQSPTAPWADARRILCMRLDSMGDLLMTTPALRAVRGGTGGDATRHVTLLTSPSGAVTARYLPEVDAIITYDAPWTKATTRRENSGPEFAIIERLRASAFNAAIIFTVFSQNPLPAAMLAMLADIPLRLAYCHENPYQLLSDWAPDPDPAEGIRHEVRRQLDLVARVGYTVADARLSFAVPEAARAKAGALLDAHGIDRARPWLVLHPGATAPARRYPAEGFVTAANTLFHEDGWQIVLTGDASERDLVTQVQAGLDVPSSVAFVDTLDLGELGALIALAPLVLTNNTGPAHLAAAVGTPVVDLYALTNPQHTPWAVPNRVLSHDVPCRNCFRSVCPLVHHHCLTLIPPEAVVAAVRDLARETGISTAAPVVAPVMEVAW